MSVELNIWSAYLPYNVNCQFEGIINGREISKQRKEFQIENEPFTNWEYYEPIKEIVGTKIAPLKAIRVYKKYFVVNCGIYAKGLKNFYNGNGAKLVLHPLSDLTKEIEFGKEKFIPAGKMITHGFHNTFWYDLEKFNYQYLYEMDYQNLLMWGFDIFKLIPNGLAVDINTLSVE